MAYLDDRIWCHPKFAEVSAGSAWAWVKSVAYSSGFNTRGRLTSGQLRTIGASAKNRRDLVEAGLWHDGPDDGITINDWDDHNGKRDARKQADRERKRAERAAAMSAGQGADSPVDGPQDSLRTECGLSDGLSATSPRARDRRRAPDDGVKEVTEEGNEGSSVSENPRPLFLTSSYESDNDDIEWPTNTTERPQDFIHIKDLITKSLQEAS